MAVALDTKIGHRKCRIEKLSHGLISTQTNWLSCCIWYLYAYCSINLNIWLCILPHLIGYYSGCFGWCFLSFSLVLFFWGGGVSGWPLLVCLLLNHQVSIRRSSAEVLVLQFLRVGGWVGLFLKFFHFIQHWWCHYSICHLCLWMYCSIIFLYAYLQKAFTVCSPAHADSQFHQYTTQVCVMICFQAFLH